MAVTFSGLSSGLDTASLIKQLVAASKASEAPLQSEQSDLAAQKSIVDNISSIVSAFGTFADSATLTSDVQFRTATASDSHVTVAVSGDAAATTHDVRVVSTAHAQTTSSNTFASDTAGIAGTGSLQINGPAGATATVSWDNTKSLSDIASQINGANAGVSASVLFDGTSYRLMVTSQQTGTANAPSFVETGSALGVADPANIKIPASDAELVVDGVDIKRPTNVIDDALPGVTLTAVSAQAASDPDTTVNVTLDQTAAASKLNDFVSKYNDAVSAVNAQLTYTGSTAPTNTLFGDSTLELLQGELSSIATAQYGTTSLDQLGVTIDKTGVMSLDTTQLDTTLAANPNALSDLFVTGGLSARLQSLSDTYTGAGTGILPAKSQGMTDQSNDLQTQIDTMETNATALQDRLQTQFNDLETAMSKLQSQSAYITKMLG